MDSSKVKTRKLQAEPILGNPALTLKINHLFRVCEVSNDSYLYSYAVRLKKFYCLVNSGVNAPIKCTRFLLHKAHMRKP